MDKLVETASEGKYKIMDSSINKTKVTNFFNCICEEYDAHNYQDKEVLRSILTYANAENKDVLDIACGAGVLFDMYQELHVKSLTALDISEKMIERCQNKYPNYDVSYHCGDVEQMEFTTMFDSAVLFNAFPHIANPQILVENVWKSLRDNGRFTIAHGSNREAIDNCHSNLPKELSRRLWKNNQIEHLLEPYFQIDTSIDNERMIVISGRKKNIDG